jgi:hypothetical protein
MQVTNYQMHNVLECYRKKLSREPGEDQSANFPAEKAADALALPPETSRMATMDKISQQVLDKVADVMGSSNSPDPSRNETRENSGIGKSMGEAAAEEFTYHVMDSIHRKRTARLPMGDPAALARRLDQMAERSSASPTDSWN